MTDSNDSSENGNEFHPNNSLELNTNSESNTAEQRVQPTLNMNNSTAALPLPTTNNQLEALTRYAPAIRAFALAVCRAMFLPAFILYLIWELRDGFNVVSLRGSICRSAMLVLPAVFVLQILRNSFRKGGLVELHFRWPQTMVSGLQSCTNLVHSIAIPLYAMYLTFQTFEQGQWSDSLGRILFNAAMLVLGIAFWRVARCMKWTLSDSGSDKETVHALTRIYSWALFAAAFAPLAICAMSLSGWHFGAEQLGWRLLASCVVALLLALVTGFVSRILLVTQFKVQIAHETESEPVDIHGISRQVNRLLSVTALVVAVVVGWRPVSYTHLTLPTTPYV